MEWAPIREKLGSRLTAQMEGGLKLTITSRCSNKCPGADQNVFLYPDGMQRLLNHCGEIRTALNHNQHYSIVLEVRTDICINQIDFVVATAIGNRLMLIYVEFDMLGAIITCAAANSINNTSGINPLRTQSIGLSLGAFEKLEHFTRGHMLKVEVLPTIPEEKEEEEETSVAAVTTNSEVSPPPPAVEVNEPPTTGVDKSTQTEPERERYPETLDDTYDDDEYVDI